VLDGSGYPRTDWQLDLMVDVAVKQRTAIRAFPRTGEGALGEGGLIPGAELLPQVGVAPVDL
jgi:hypothetical protein